MEIDKLNRHLNREREARLLAEKLLEEKNLELIRSTQELSELNGKLEQLVRKRTDEINRVTWEARRANGFMSALLANLQAGILVEDETNTITHVNQTYCDLFEKPDLPLMIEGNGGEDEFDEIMSQFSNPLDFIETRKRYIAGKKIIYSNELSLADGRIIEQSYFPIFFEDEKGNTSHNHLWSFRDISEAKQREVELALAKEEAEAASRSKSLFLATMSHEIRTPMNGVLGMLHLLGNTQLDDLQKHYVRTASNSGEMLLRVINDILDFSKLEASKLELEEIILDPRALVEETAALMAKGAAEKGLELICSIDESVPTHIKGDPTRLRQILINLTSNAIKFTEHGHVALYCHSFQGQITFGVMDTGIGLSPDQQVRIFEAFSQADSSHTRKYGGTGLGLAICRRLVEAMGGELRLASAKNIGSDFCFEIPLQAEDVKFKSVVSHYLDDRRILVVDDCRASLSAIRRMLENWKVESIGEAATSAAAMSEILHAEAKREPYDTILLDSDAAEGNCKNFIEAVLTVDELKNIKIIIMTPVGKESVCGCADMVVSKPILPSELYNALQYDDVSVTSIVIEAPQPDKYSFGGRSLLLAEDNTTNQEVAQAILSNVGFDIDICDNGADAVSLVQKKRYDAVLMDIQMPVMDGLEATRQIRLLGGNYADLPVIAMTAHALVGDHEKSIEAGMNGHIVKPINPELLFAELAHWVKQGVASQTVTDFATADELPELPGIDLVSGLNRINGNWSAYWQILRNFARNNADKADEIERSIQQGQLDDAAKLAHSLKGSGGNISASEIYTHAAELERLCRAGRMDESMQYLESLRAALREVLDGLSSLEQPGSERAKQDGSADVIDEDEFSRRIHIINEQLNSDFSEAQTCFRALLHENYGKQHKKIMAELDSAMCGYDIDSAKSVLQKFDLLVPLNIE